MSTTANDVLAMARSQIGIKEIPAGSNNVKYNTAYYGRAVSGDSFPWCCAFVWWVFQQVGAALFYGGGKTAYCPALEVYAKNHGQWVTSDYRPGDCVLFDFYGGGKGLACHIGIVESVSSSGIICIEGNTSVTSSDNGGAVMRRTRYLNQILGAFRPAYSAESAESEDIMTGKEIYDALNEYLRSVPCPDAAKAELQEAVDLGITDGGRPLELTPRYQTAIMAKRAIKGKK